MHDIDIASEVCVTVYNILGLVYEKNLLCKDDVKYIPTNLYEKETNYSRDTIVVDDDAS